LFSHLIVFSTQSTQFYNSVIENIIILEQLNAITSDEADDAVVMVMVVVVVHNL